MSETASVFEQRTLMIIFTYASAGLGHLRVTDALYHGLPGHPDPILLRSPDASIAYLHHLTSVHPSMRAVMEWMQRGTPEELFTRSYRRMLRSRNRLLYEHINTLLDERWTNPDTVLVIATHFGLAHQLAAIKNRLSYERQVRIILVLQVTDDSPQRIWYVAGADLIVVPSERTKAALIDYGKMAGLPPVRFEVLPYPVSPLLADEISTDSFEQRVEQLDPGSVSEIEVMIPISGAAVGLNFFRQLMDDLHGKSPRFRFHVVAKSSAYTSAFLKDMQTRPFISPYTSSLDREVVDIYEQVYAKVLLALEVTKPSEQAFKALVDPRRRGGCLLLFSHPVGRQEHDNLDFMSRHQLLPNEQEQQRLWDDAHNGKALEFALLEEALHWRGVRLPDEPHGAANFIWWSLEQGLFAQMLHCRPTPRPNDPSAYELGADGVRQFWDSVTRLLAEPAIS